ncbi:hypothetical protein ACIA03_29805 [Nocardioides sp. NPDC051685]|uniref:hypothetical protein n=1 Tax=Nocardioides sp. NPDC051685 TaxID=3364334 RepID=UPI00379514EF
MSRTSFVSRLRDQVIRPLIHSALTEHEIPEVTVAVVTGTEHDSSLRDPREPYWTFPDDGDDGHEYVWVHATYQPTNEAAEWRLGRTADLHESSELVDALQELGSRVEDWLCETSFAWGEERHTRRLGFGDLPEWTITGA